MMEISGRALADIRDHGREAYPYEACGFVLGRLEASGGARGMIALRALNSSGPESRRRRFQIGAEEFMTAESQAESEGLDLLAVYHSHPDHPARPSEHDLKMALPFYRYLILAVEYGAPRETTCWRLADDRSGFSAEELTEADGEGR
jgi:proteasome lid subunit RPN8/RPN11